MIHLATLLMLQLLTRSGIFRRVPTEGDELELRRKGARASRARAWALTALLVLCGGGLALVDSFRVVDEQKLLDEAWGSKFRRDREVAAVRAAERGIRFDLDELDLDIELARADTLASLLLRGLEPPGAGDDSSVLDPGDRRLRLHELEEDTQHWQSPNHYRYDDLATGLLLRTPEPKTKADTIFWIFGLLMTTVVMVVLALLGRAWLNAQRTRVVVSQAGLVLTRLRGHPVGLIIDARPRPSRSRPAAR